MIDLHCHILPEIDDGPSTVEDSVSLLKMLKEQDVDTVVATPHFYPLETTLQDFLSKRESSFNKLKNEIKNEDYPKLILGAEVYYFSGIGKSEAIKELKIGDSDYILIELPFCDLDDYVLNDVLEIKDNLGLMPIIAHIERYSKFKGYKKLLEFVYKGLFLAQVNTSSLISRPENRRTKKLIKKGLISFIASDAHSVRHRRPYFYEALNEIRESVSLIEYGKILEKNKEFAENISLEKL